uniref:Fatty acid desaturase, type 1 n=1 Tax=Tanacetum cinerariifolium TaxID=118510 RepID=A0A6L2KWV6_TANCI|nr:fatty acid desaturase, type 1 [Tanacetum cinerariifolium]
MGAGGKMNISKIEKDLLKRVPVSKPPFGIGDLKRTIPPHCFKRSLIHSFASFFRDLIIIYALYYLASNYIPLLPQTLLYIAWPLYWLAQGIQTSRLLDVIYRTNMWYDVAGLKDIVQLNYSGKLRVVLFQCDWVDIDKGCKTDEFEIKLVNFSYLTHKGDNLLDDPFVLASQVDKVLYAHDSKLGDWMVARHVKVKDAFNMQCDTDENILSSLPYSNVVPSLHRVGVDVVDGVDGTLVLESQKVEDDENEQE